MTNFLKFFGFITGLGLTIIVNVVNSEIFHHDSSIVERFRNWVDTHRIESRDEHHLSHIFENWLSNDKYIELTNSKNLTWSVAHNAFSGMNSEEFAELMGFRANAELLEGNAKTGNLNTRKQENIIDVLPPSVDWRTEGVVTAVKDQGSCGSCWSFSTTGALEGIYAITHGNLVSFSEQELVDCDYGRGKNHGCNGGLMDDAFSFISSNGGLCSEESYPYVSGTTQKVGTCKTCESVSGSKISTYTDVLANSDNAMMSTLAQQPVAVAIDAEKDFQLYASGVFTAKCGTDLNHGVLLVGYSSQNGLDYYILKNSWGTGWGMDGYILLGKGNDPATGKPYNNGAGQCGVLGMASYPSL